MSTLDQILDATPRVSSSKGPRILGENHDPNSINFVAGMSDPGEMIRCGYRPELRRQQGEDDTTYAARIRPLVMALPKEERDVIMNAAVKRANLDVSNGRVSVFVAGKQPAWHELGTWVAEAVNSAEARQLANIAWTVSKRPLTYQVDGGHKQSKRAWSIVRDDTNEELGTVGRIYKPIQNDEGFDFLDSVLAEHGARYESAGAIYGGQKVWMLAHLPRYSFSVAGKDRVEKYVLFSNPHDGSGAGSCDPCDLRVECGNSWRRAMRENPRGIRLFHNAKLEQRIEEAKVALGIVANDMVHSQEEAEAMYAKPLPNIQHYANDVLDAVLDITAAEMDQGADLLAKVLAKTQAQFELAQKTFEKKIEARNGILEEILEAYESKECESVRGTVWGGLQAFTDRNSHGGKRYNGNAETKASKRFESILWGEADKMNQVAYGKALELAK